MSTLSAYEKEIAFQSSRRRAGVELIKIISDLWYDKSIEMVLFRNQLLNLNVSEILNLHDYAGEFVGKPISIFDSVEIGNAIYSMNLPPAKLDIGKLTYEFHKGDNKHNNATAFVLNKLKKAQDFKNRVTITECSFKNAGTGTKGVWHGLAAGAVVVVAKSASTCASFSFCCCVGVVQASTAYRGSIFEIHRMD